MLRIIWLLIALIVALPASAQRDPTAPDYYDVAYADESRLQRLDVYLPDTEDPAPVLFLVHGGGYFFGDKAELAPFAAHFRDLGYAVVSANYRLAPRVTYPTLIEDVVCALAWTHAHADAYGYDASHLYVVGDSAGGNAALLLGTHDDLSAYLNNCDHPAPETWLNGVIAYYPIVDLATCESDCEASRRAMALYLGERTFAPDAWGSASPVAHLDKGDPPFLLIHGTGDRVVPVSESLYFSGLLEQAGVDFDLLLIDDAPHAFIEFIDAEDDSERYDPARQAAEKVADWLAEQQRHSTP